MLEDDNGRYGLAPGLTVVDMLTCDTSMSTDIFSSSSDVQKVFDGSGLQLITFFL